MPKVKKTWDILAKDRRAYLLRAITTFFQTKRDEEIGLIAAEEILDFFLENLHTDFYNRAVADAKIMAKKNAEDLDFNLEILMKK
jgi:uncharacterized protein (DUF2164 family)